LCVGTRLVAALGAAMRVERRVGPRASREHRQQLHKSGDEVDDAEAADRSAREVVGHERPQNRPDPGEVILLPERGPRQNDQQEPDFEEESDVKEPADQGYPRVSMLTRRSTRASTSR